jgi:hypothetical protein
MNMLAGLNAEILVLWHVVLCFQLLEHEHS